MLIAPKLLSAGPYLTTANILLGMILMVVLNSLLTGIKSRDRNYLLLGLFFSGSFINAVSNLYSYFIIPTIEPYIGSWISLLAFTRFSYNYLNIKQIKLLKPGKTIMTVICLIFFCLSIIHNIVNKDDTNLLILIMDISAALLILILFIALIIFRVHGNKKAGSLIIFEVLIVIGAISAMSIFKNSVEGAGIPPQLLQGNFIFLFGMVISGLLFSYILGAEMTELKINHALAEQDRKKLLKLDKAKNDFMMNISHELRTPVTIINGIIHQLRAGRWGNSIKAADNQFEIIERNNLRLMKQINGLLELSQLDQHRFKMNPEVINLSERLLLFAAEFQSAAEQKNIKIDFHCRENIDLYADPHLFDTAILNLISNAIKFTSEGGIIKLEAERKHNKIIINVADNGPGIPEEQQKRIFDRFQQVENSETSIWHGAGIGLSLVKGIMELHNGSIELFSRPGKGSRFSLLFPKELQTRDKRNLIRIDPVVSAYKADLATALEESKPQKRYSAGSDIRKKTILIVEDNKDLLNYLETELAESFNVITASNGKTALEILKSFKPSLIISDVMMPEMDGRQLYSKIRNKTEYTKIPFLFLTARNSAEEKLEALNDGAVDYISKPFSIHELRARAAAIIDSIQYNNENYQEELKRSVIRFIDTFDSTVAQTSEADNFESYCSEQELTRREKDIAVLIRKGMSDKEIAAKLKLSTKTISNYNTSVFRKLEVSGRSELIALKRE